MNKVFIVMGLTDRWQTILEVFQSRQQAEEFVDSIPEKDDADGYAMYYPYNGICYDAILIDERSVR